MPADGWRQPSRPSSGPPQPRTTGRSSLPMERLEHRSSKESPLPSPDAPERSGQGRQTSFVLGKVSINRRGHTGRLSPKTRHSEPALEIQLRWQMLNEAPAFPPSRAAQLQDATANQAALFDNHQSHTAFPGPFSDPGPSSPATGPMPVGSFRAASAGPARRGGGCRWLLSVREEAED